jgi:hypothetical protein
MVGLESCIGLTLFSGNQNRKNRKIENKKIKKIEKIETFREK